MDSGSDISLLTNENYNFINNNPNNIVRNSNITNIEGLGGFTTPLGEVRIGFKIQNFTFNVDFIIVENLPVSGILGRDFLNRYKAKLNYETGTLTVNNISIPLIPTHKNNYCFNISRVNEIFKLLECALTKIPIEARDSLKTLIMKYLDIFRLPNEPIPPVNFYEQRIVLSDQKPVYIPQYRIPHSHRDEIKRQVLEMLEMGIIRHSTSNYNNPCLLVPKKKPGEWRFVTDFRQLNRKVIPDKYPLPRFDDIFDGLGKTTPHDRSPKFYSSFDLMKGFYQIPLNEESRKYTAFNVGFGFFEYTRLPFGISVAPNGFSRMIAMAFEPLLGKNAFVFIDDVVIKSHTINEHLDEIEQVFKICRERNLSLNPGKLQFFKDRITYLGHELNEWGIFPDRVKFDVISKWPSPTNKDEAKRFVSFAGYYRRFVQNFAEIAHPINNLTKKRVEFKWDDECERSFHKLKHAVSNPPILIFPDFMKLFIIVCDASQFALGAVLGHDIDKLFRPIHFASRSLNKSEQNKSTIEKELLAIYWSIIYFKPYIYGRHFLIRSDHKPLIYLFGLKDPTGKLNRMRLEIGGHSFTIEYIKGKDNALADGLSRITIEDLQRLNSMVVRVCAVTTRRQAQKAIQDKISETNPSELDQSKDKSPLPLKININDQSGSKEKVINTKFLEANHFSSRRYPEMMFDLGAGLIIVGYSLRLRNPIRLIKINYKSANDSKNAPTTASGSNKRLKIDKESMLEKQIENAFIQINELAKKLKITNVRLNKLDPIFQIINVHKLNSLATKLTNINVFLFSSPQKLNNKENKNEIENILRAYHNDPLTGGHSGYSRMLSKLRMKYEWKGMTKDVVRHVKNCEKCQLNKPSRKTIEQLCITETPSKALEMISMDTVGPLTEANGFKYILTIQCNLSKYVIAFPLKSKSANSIAEGLYQGFIYIFGFPKVIISDFGSEYSNSIFKEITETCKIEHRVSAGYRPQTIGGLERNHRVLNEYLRHYLSNNHDNWPNLLKSYQFAYNTTPNETISNYTPYELIFGKTASLPDFIQDTVITPVYNIENYAKQLQYQLHTTQIQARTYLEEVKQKQKINYDKKAKPSKIIVGSKVKLVNEQRNKFDPKYLGPYIVTKIIKPNAYIKKANSTNSKKVHMDRLVEISLSP